MPSKIKPRYNARSNPLPVDTEVEAVIVTPYVLNPTTGEFEAQGLNTVTPTSVDLNNSSTAPIAAGGNFTGTSTDVSNYVQISIALWATPSTAKGSLYIEFSKDNVNWDISVPFFIRNPTFIIPIPLIHVNRYFRLRYLNDGGVSAIAALGLIETAGTPATLTAVRFTTTLFTIATKELVRTLDQTIQGSDPVNLSRSVLMGKQPDGDYANTPANGSISGNTTTTNLNANQTFTGTPQDTTGYVGGMCMFYSSHVGGSDGIEIQFSETTDFTLIHRRVTATYDLVTEGVPIFFPVMQGEYMRVRYVNGGTATTTFLIRTEFFIDAAQVPLGALTANTITDRSLSAMSRGVIVAKNTLGAYGNILRGVLGGLSVNMLEHATHTPIRPCNSWSVVKGSVGTTESEFVSPAKAVSVNIFNSDNNITLRIAPSTASHAAGNYRTVLAGNDVTIELGPGVSIWIRSSSGTASVELIYAMDTTI